MSEPQDERALIEAELTKARLLGNVSKTRLKKLAAVIVSGIAPENENWLATWRRCDAGELLIQQGTYSSDFFVLWRGVVRAYRTSPEGATAQIGTILAGDRCNWFGEMPALSNQPQQMRFVAETACTLLQIQGPGFKKLYEDKGQDPANPSPTFKSLVDKHYQERALAFHLRVAPLFRDLAEEQLRAIAEGAELVTYQKDQVIAQRGKEADAVYLVRSGIVKVIAQRDGADVFHAALCDNSSFGERALIEGGKWPATYAAYARADLVKLPRALFSSIFAGDASVQALLKATASSLVAREEGLQSPAAKHLVKASDVLVIDLHKCTRCNACVDSCVAVHDDGVPRLSKRGLVNEQRTEMLASACYHCKTPDCMLSCNFGAIRRTLQGEIEFIYDACTGCKFCERSCPYGVIRMADLLSSAVEPHRSKSFFGLLPVLALFLPRREPARAAPPAGDVNGSPPRQKAIKCDFCAGLPFEACVYNCPCGAIRRTDPRDLDFQPANPD